MSWRMVGMTPVWRATIDPAPPTAGTARAERLGEAQLREQQRLHARTAALLRRHLRHQLAMMRAVGSLRPSSAGSGTWAPGRPTSPSKR
jgi:hypothetical protein